MPPRRASFQQYDTLKSRHARRSTTTSSLQNNQRNLPTVVPPPPTSHGEQTSLNSHTPASLHTVNLNAWMDGVSDTTPLLNSSSPRYRRRVYGNTASLQPAGHTPGLPFTSTNDIYTGSYPYGSISHANEVLPCPNKWTQQPSRPSSNSSTNPKFDNSTTPYCTVGSLMDFDVNNPPSVPSSPAAFRENDDANSEMFSDFRQSPSNVQMENERYSSAPMNGDAILNIGSPAFGDEGSFPVGGLSGNQRRRLSCTANNPAEADVCFPQDGLADLDGNFDSLVVSKRRRKRHVWPNLRILEDWSAEEKEKRTLEGIRTRTIHEPLYIDGRLRSRRSTWPRHNHQMTEDGPYRFTYFNVDLESTIHSQTLSELPQAGQTFKDLFLPERRILSDDEDEDQDTSEADSTLEPTSRVYPVHCTSLACSPFNDEILSESKVASGETESKVNIQLPESVTSHGDSSRYVKSKINVAYCRHGRPYDHRTNEPNCKICKCHHEQVFSPEEDADIKGGSSSMASAVHPSTTHIKKLRKRYGDRPTFWLDVLSPTAAEMRILQKAFGLHALTVEDILEQDAREKVELFRHYYFVNYRSFEQDKTSEMFMEPVNMYAVVFREGIITFHWSMTPHPANVRRRIRQLADYIRVSADWISYALIDDITDAFAPLIESIEDEVDEIDEAILDVPSLTSGQEKSNRPGSGASGNVNSASPRRKFGWFKRYKKRGSQCGGESGRLMGVSNNGCCSGGTGDGGSNSGGENDRTLSGASTAGYREIDSKGKQKSQFLSYVQDDRRKSGGCGTDTKSKTRCSDKAHSGRGDGQVGQGGSLLNADGGMDMLRRVGECRKKVMSLYRLLGNKADVIKGFAKRCNEQWNVAPKSDIGMFLGDIQDHIVTMTGNLSHYENILSRAHSNYLAQINIRMTERAESTNDVLNKLTVLGTIVLPMNIITGMWGMNVMVPGEGSGSLTWFYGISLFLFTFVVASFLIAKRTFELM